MNKKNFIFIISLFLLIALNIYLRIENINYESNDFKVYLLDWINFMRRNGTFNAFHYDFSNYSPLYLHLLGISVDLNLKELFYVKILDFIFEVFAAFWVYKIMRLKYSIERAGIISIIFLLIPTIILNGSKWGQCDIIYTSMIIAGAYFVLKEKFVVALFFIGISYAFKQQSVFIFPVIAILLLSRKINWKQLLIIPIPIIISFIPSVLAGKGIFQIAEIYFHQDNDSDKMLNANTPNFYNFIKYDELNYNSIKIAGIIVTGLFTVLAIIFLFKNHRYEIKEKAIWIFLFFSILIPFFLPRMHERYFMIAECFSFIAVCFYKKYYYLPLLVIFPSVITYHYYFTGSLNVSPLILSISEFLSLIIISLILFTGQTKTEIGKQSSV